jgi:hypothetical protein
MSQTIVFNQQCLFAGLSEAFERLVNAAISARTAQLLTFVVVVPNS